MKSILILSLFIIHITVLRGQWTASFGPTGFAYTQVTCFTQVGSNYFCGTQGDGIWRSTDNSASPWTKVSDTPTGKRVNALLKSGTDLYAATDSGVFKSTNNGTNWTKLSVGTSFILSFAVIGTNIFAGGGGVYLSSDAGMTWHPRSNGLLPPSVSSLAVIGTNLFAGTFGGGVYYSPDNGSNWTTASSGLPNNNITEIASAGSNLFSVAYQFPNAQVFVSTNSGTNWNSANSGLPSSQEVHFAVSGPNIFAGAYSNGVYLTTDGGSSWTEVNQGFGTSRTIRSLGILGNDLFAGFYQYDVFRRPLDQMITDIEQTSDLQPNQFFLEQNFPNPFNPSTSIQYQVSSSSQVSLKAYDVLGNEVETLVDEFKTAGKYEIGFRTEGLSSGVYFYKLQAGSFIQTKKMILLR